MKQGIMKEKHAILRKSLKIALTDLRGTLFRLENVFNANKRMGKTLIDQITSRQKNTIELMIIDF
jgi:hypothetical protein